MDSSQTISRVSHGKGGKKIGRSLVDSLGEAEPVELTDCFNWRYLGKRGEPPSRLVSRSPISVAAQPAGSGRWREAKSCARGQHCRQLVAGTTAELGSWLTE